MRNRVLTVLAVLGLYLPLTSCASDGVFPPGSQIGVTFYIPLGSAPPPLRRSPPAPPAPAKSGVPQQGPGTATLPTSPIYGPQ